MQSASAATQGDTSAVSAVDLSVIIPVHNGAAVLARTIELWRERALEGRTEVLIVENGSSDDSWSVAQRHAVSTPSVIFVLMRARKGMGAALRAGIAASQGDRVLLTADDLPFGFDDLNRAAELPTRPVMVIGSKAHRQSDVGRSRARSLQTRGFRALRRIILGSRVGDSQGTLLCDGAWLRAVAPHCSDQGFLFTTQLVYAAELNRLPIIEVPVRLRPRAGEKSSSVRVQDVWTMGIGLLHMRAIRSVFRRIGAPA